MGADKFAAKRYVPQATFKKVCYILYTMVAYLVIFPEELALCIPAFCLHTCVEPFPEWEAPTPTSVYSVTAHWNKNREGHWYY